MFRSRIFCVSLCPLLLVLSLGTTGYCPFRYFFILMKSWALSSPGWEVPAFSLFLGERCSSPGPVIIVGVLYWTLSSSSRSLSHWGAWSCVETFRWALSAEQSGITSLHLLAMPLQCSPGHCQHSLLQGCIADSCSAGPPALPRALSAKLLSSWSVPSISWCLGWLFIL